MPGVDSIEVVNRQIAEAAWSHGDWETVDRLVSEDYVTHPSAADDAIDHDPGQLDPSPRRCDAPEDTQMAARQSQAGDYLVVPNHERVPRPLLVGERGPELGDPLLELFPTLFPEATVRVVGPVRHARPAHAAGRPSRAWVIC